MKSAPLWAATALLAASAGLPGPCDAQTAALPGSTPELPFEGAQPSADPELGDDFNARFQGVYRLRTDAYINPGVTDRSVPDFAAVQHRLLVRLDAGTQTLRGVVEVAGGLQDGRRPSPYPGDRGVELQQAWLGYSTPAFGGTAQLRLGRQPIVLGSTRFFAARDGTNIEQAYDGARLIWTGRPTQVSVFAVAPVRNRDGGPFNDDPAPGQRFWGIYAHRLPQPLISQLDLYYVGLHRPSATFLQGTARETRHSFGLLARDQRGPWYSEVEGVYQFGRFGAGTISAFFASAQLGYTFENVAWRPGLFLRGDVISGDRDPKDHDLQTFNPLFPNTSFFSKAAIFGPANAIDLYPKLKVQPRKGVDVSIGADVFWRYSRGDALYRPAVQPRIAPGMSNARYVGPIYLTEINWQVTPAIFVDASYAYAKAEGFVRETGGRDLQYLLAEISLKF